MANASTTPDQVHHLEGRNYEIKVSKKHRPAQIPRDSAPVLYEGEVTTDNAGDFDVRFVRRDLHLRLCALTGVPQYKDMTFNQMLEALLDKAGAPSPQMSTTLIEGASERG